MASPGEELASTCRRIVPGLGRLSSYDRSWLSADVIAGLTVWGLVVPEAMAYAGIAGLPAQAGLYTLLVSMLAYATFGTSRHLIVAGTSATAALVGSTVVALHPADPAQYAAYAAGLVLIVGLLFLAAGMARAGFIAQFLSRPVTDGFVVGLAIFVAVGQLNKIFGVTKGSGDTVQKFVHVVSQLDTANWWSAAAGTVALVALFGIPRLSARVPAGLLVLAVAIVASGALGLHANHGVEVVGKLPAGLPSVALPRIGLSSLWTLVPAALGIVLVAYSEALGVAQAFATKHGYDVDPNQELVAFGAANLASGLVGGLAACGGMSASAVNEGSGSRSEASGLVATAMTLLTVLVLTPLFRSLPEAVLGALIIHAVSHMMRVDKLKAVYRLSPTEFWLGVTALVGVVVFDVLQGLVIAMVASLLLVLYRSSLAKVAVLGAMPGTPDQFAAIDRQPDARPVDGVLIVRADEAIYYANVTSTVDAIKALVRDTRPTVRAVVFRPEALHSLDVTSLEVISALLDWLRERNIEIYVVRPHTDLIAELERTGLLEAIAPDHVVPTIAEAVARAQRGHGPEAADPT